MGPRIDFPRKNCIIPVSIVFYFPKKEAFSVKYLYQIMLITVFSLLGELCRYCIPFPIPASIYGMVLLFLTLSMKIIPKKSVEDVGGFLTSFLPVLFVAPTVNIVASWDLIRGDLIVLILVCIVTTIITFAASGLVTDWLVRRKGDRHD